MNDYADFSDRPQPDVWRSLNRLLVTLIFFAAILLIAYPFVIELKKQREDDARIEQLKAEIQKQKEILAQHMREVELLKNDPAYIETIARDRLDLMKRDETVYRIENARPAPAPGSFHRNN